MIPSRTNCGVKILSITLFAIGAMSPCPLFLQRIELIERLLDGRLGALHDRVVECQGDKGLPMSAFDLDEFVPEVIL